MFPVGTKPDDTALATAIADLAALLGDRLQLGAAIRAQHGHTTTWIENQPPDAVAFPQATEEVAAIVKICARHSVPVIPFGSGTSLEGHVNAPLGGICVTLEQMNKIIAVNAEDFDCVIQPGLTREELNHHLRDRGLFFPIDPGANASLGGMAATRASGTNAVRYGTMKDNVLSLEAVMADGRIVRTGGRARKSSAGFDMTRLLVGSEGTLAIITELTLKLHGIPEAMSSARCSFPSVEDACKAVILTAQMGIPVARIELLDRLSVRAVNAYSKLDLPETPLLLLEFHGSAAAVAEQAETFGLLAKECGSGAFEWTANAEDRNRLWQARHSAYWASLALRPGAKGLSTDVCVPLSRLAECVSAAQNRAAELGFTAPIVGHVGDGNFHALLLVDTDDPAEIERAETFIGWLNDLALSMDGTCTGEHGIGQGKSRYLAKELGPMLGYMARVKAALDPKGIMNPGKIFPASRE